ncbi:MAG: cyclic nucleotide-binding domain-containing protein [Candidatus Hydrothermales bacterium]
MKDIYKNFLLRHPLLKNLGERGLEEISSIASFINLKKGEILFKEGSEGEDLYIIVEGEAEVLKTDKLVKIAELKEGALIGELSFLLKEGRTATLRAIKDSVFFRIDGKLLEEKILKSEKIYVEILFSISKIVAERLKTVNSLLSDYLKKHKVESDELCKLRESLKEEFIF